MSNTLNAKQNKKKKLTYVIGQFDNITKPQDLVVPGRPNKKRAVVTLITEDGQLAFFEVRDEVLAKISKLGITPGDVVNIGFVFIGSQRAERAYNNLFINYIDFASNE